MGVTAGSRGGGGRGGMAGMAAEAFTPGVPAMLADFNHAGKPRRATGRILEPTLACPANRILLQKPYHACIGRPNSMPASADFQTNAAAMRVLVDDLNAQIDKVAAGGDEARAKHVAPRRKLLPRKTRGEPAGPGTPLPGAGAAGRADTCTTTTHPARA